eukprot:gene9534-10260_t
MLLYVAQRILQLCPPDGKPLTAVEKAKQLSRKGYQSTARTRRLC